MVGRSGPASGRRKGCAWSAGGASERADGCLWDARCTDDETSRDEKKNQAGGNERHRAWSRRWDSNPRPSLYKSVALPLSYVGRRRFSLRIHRNEPGRHEGVARRRVATVEAVHLAYPRGFAILESCVMACNCFRNVVHTTHVTDTQASPLKGWEIFRRRNQAVISLQGVVVMARWGLLWSGARLGRTGSLERAAAGRGPNVADGCRERNRACSTPVSRRAARSVQRLAHHIFGGYNVP